MARKKTPQPAAKTAPQASNPFNSGSNPFIGRIEGRRQVRVQYPRKLSILDAKCRYKVAHGGRGGAKSWNFARKLIERAYSQPTRILCAREYQNSIAESVHKLLVDQIHAMGLGDFFEVTQNSIRTKHHGEDKAGGHGESEFIFAGLKNNITKIKSMEGVDVVWVEEAEKVSESSWEVLIPTIRKPGSEIWISFNPNLETDPTYVRFVKNTPDDCAKVEINWRDNPWFPETLRKEMEYLKRVDYDAYLHVWEGHPRNNSDAQVLRGKIVVEAFEPHAEGTGEWHGPYYGADWGFAQDPTTLVKCWINGTRLYVEHEAYGIGVDIDATPAMFDTVPGARQSIVYADSARPETISYMQRNGYAAMRGVDKWPGSVEDGIAHLRSYEKIVVHPRCEHTILEGRLYSFKVDKLTSQVQAVVVDAHNHCIDAIRYALSLHIKHASNMGLVMFVKQQIAEQNTQRAATPAGGGVRTVSEQPNNTGVVSKPWSRADLDKLRPAHD